jgi:acyl dehydratase
LTQAEHEAFALLSGDFNPLHTDAQYARRLLFGGPATHGVHLVMRALETCAQTQANMGALIGLQARFFPAAHPGDTLNIRMVRSCQGSPQLALHSASFRITDVHDRLLVKLKVQWTSERAEGDPILPSTISPSPCESLSDADIADSTGTFPLFLNQAALQDLFPKLSGGLSTLQLASLLGTTYVVGSGCPVTTRFSPASI